jgi:hypothetical protein
MAESSRQKRISGRVMHEFKHGELKSGRGGKGGPVKSRRQAIAIALEEAGASKYESPRRNRRNLRRTEHKEAEGETAQQESVRAARISVLTASGKAPQPWRDVTPRGKPHAAVAQPLPALAEPMAIPGRNFMKKPERSMSKAVLE